MGAVDSAGVTVSRMVRLRVAFLGSALAGALTVLFVCTAGGALAQYSDDYGSKFDPLKDDDPAGVIGPRNRIRKEVVKADDRYDGESQEQPPRAKQNLYERFDGSEFRTPTFDDTDFSKHDYSDLTQDSMRGDRRGDEFDTDRRDGSGDDGGDRLRKLDADTDDAAWMRYGYWHDDRVQTKRAVRNRKEWLELTSPIPGALYDWVPDKVDPLDNGGFALSPDNGSPVPYRLNGHVDWERGLPWGKGD